MVQTTGTAISPRATYNREPNVEYCGQRFALYWASYNTVGSCCSAASPFGEALSIVVLGHLWFVVICGFVVFFRSG